MRCDRGTLVAAGDGLPARCVGPWSLDKLYYVARYLDLFSRAMHQRFPERHYLDLFAGPGWSVLDDGSGEIEGSPLVALSLAHRFTRYHFVDADSTAVLALRQRVARLGWRGPDVQFYEEDANEIVTRLGRAVPSSALSVAVIDPTGLDFRFDALRILTHGRRMDLIYVFPEGMAAKRNLQTFLRQDHSALDDVLGTRAWRESVAPHLRRALDRQAYWDHVGRPLVQILQDRLADLGYQSIHLGSEIVAIHNRRNVPLYYLVFASKHSLGHKFWKAIAQYDPRGQARLF
jgi:three-Cys-motif partner protein